MPPIYMDRNFILISLYLFQRSETSKQRTLLIYMSLIEKLSSFQGFNYNEKFGALCCPSYRGYYYNVHMLEGSFSLYHEGGVAILLSRYIAL